MHKIGLRLNGLGFRDYNLGFGILGCRYRFLVLGIFLIRIHGQQFRVYISFWDVEFRASGIVFMIHDEGF
jgi:hypothetical protein